MSNARLSERAPFLAEVDVLAAGASAPRRVWACDLSETGMFVQSGQPFRIGDRVSLRFDVESNEIHVPAAEVMWVRGNDSPFGDEQVPGAGLRFLAVDGDTRVALRRFVQPRAEHTTLPEAEAIPLWTSSPPAAAEHSPHISLPPFSQPPLQISMPPDEPLEIPDDVRVFRHTKPNGVPRPVSLAPHDESERAGRPVLRGWAFRHDGRGEKPTGGGENGSEKTSIGAPTASLVPLLSVPPEERGNLQFERDRGLGLSLGDDGFQLGALPFSADARARALEAGDLAIRHMPVAEDRRPTPASSRTTNRSLPIAVGLLCAGTLVGIGLGAANKHLRRAPPAPSSVSAVVVDAPEPAATAIASPSNAEVQAARADAMRTAAATTLASVTSTSTSTRAGAAVPAAAAAGTQDASTASTIVSPSTSTSPTVASTPPTLTTTAATLSPAGGSTNLAATSQRKLTLDPTVRATLAPTTALPSPKGPASATSARATNIEASQQPTQPTRPTPPEAQRMPSGEQLSLSVGAARLVKSFALASPTRIVVDLADATMPQTPPPASGRITRIRFGTPAPGTTRVVLELKDATRPSDVDAQIRGGQLRVRFR